MGKTVKKKYPLLEIIVFLIFVTLSCVMFCFHELNHEEIQNYLLAKDSTLASVLFMLPHYRDVSPLYMAILCAFAKIGIPATIALKMTSFPFSLISAFLIIFKLPIKRWLRICVPFMFFFFYEYTIISSSYSILFFAFLWLALLFKKRNKNPRLYIVALLVLGMCGIYGVVFAISLSAVWAMEIVWKNTEEAWVGQNLATKRPLRQVFFTIGILFLFALPLIPNRDSYYSMFTDHTHPIRNLIYTIFILPSDAVVTDVDFSGLLQNTSWKFVGFKPLSISAYVASAIILLLLYLITYRYKKRRYFIAPFLLFSITAAIGNLYNYQIGVIVAFELFVLWICFDETEEIREYPRWIRKLDLKYKHFSQIAVLLLGCACVAVSIAWSSFSCVNDIKNDVWYAKQLNAVLEDYHLTDYRIVSDWDWMKLENGALYLKEDYLSIQNHIEMEDDILETEKETDYSEKEKSRGNYVITYYVKQYDPAEFCQMPDSLSFADCVVYSKYGSNYISNLNHADSNMRYTQYSYKNAETSKMEALKLGEKGYPDIIIGDPNLVGLMGLSAENVRYYLIYEIRIRTSYKLFSGYQSWQVYIRDDLYLSRDKWPFMEQTY